MTLLENSKLLNRAMNPQSSIQNYFKNSPSSFKEKENIKGKTNFRDIGIQAELCSCSCRNKEFKSQENISPNSADDNLRQKNVEENDIEKVLHQKPEVTNSQEEEQEVSGKISLNKVQKSPTLEDVIQARIEQAEQLSETETEVFKLEEEEEES